MFILPSEKVAYGELKRSRLVQFKQNKTTNRADGLNQIWNEVKWNNVPFVEIWIMGITEWAVIIVRRQPHEPRLMMRPDSSGGVGFTTCVPMFAGRLGTCKGVWREEGEDVG